MQFIDAHCHLNASEFDADIDSVISRAKTKGVIAAVIVSESVRDFARTIQLTKQYPGWAFACLGVHPVQGERSVQRDDLYEALPLIKQYAEQIVGIGEVGSNV